MADKALEHMTIELDVKKRQVDRAIRSVERLSKTVKAAGNKSKDLDRLGAASDNLALRQVRAEKAALRLDKALRRQAKSARDASKARGRGGRGGGGLGGLAGGLGKAGLVGAAVTGGAVAIGRAAQAVQELSAESLVGQNIMNNLSFSVDKAAASTLGLVTDLDLATAANNAVSLGVVKNADEFAELAKVAAILGARVGQDATKSIADMTTALGRSSPLILDNLGITLSVGKANKKYAEELGITVSQLTDVQKKQAFTNEAMRLAVEVTKDATIASDGLALSLQRQSIELENNKNKLLGIDQPVRTARDVIKGLSDEQLRSVRGAKDHGAALEELNQILRDAGAEDLTGREAGLAVAREEELRVTARIEAEADGSAAKQRAAEEQAAANAQEIADNKALLPFFDQQIALAKARGDEVLAINALEQQQLELKALNLELEGDIAKAEALRFKAKVKQVAAETSSTKGRVRGGRGRRRKKKGKEFHLTSFEQLLDETLGSGFKIGEVRGIRKQRLKKEDIRPESIVNINNFNLGGIEQTFTESAGSAQEQQAAALVAAEAAFDKRVKTASRKSRVNRAI